jgi:hypothetical protein
MLLWTVLDEVTWGMGYSILPLLITRDYLKKKNVI